jgi:hypothetical protein
MPGKLEGDAGRGKREGEVLMAIIYIIQCIIYYTLSLDVHGVH